MLVVRRAVALVTVSSLALLGIASLPATAVNADHGAVLVSPVPAAQTPHVMDGSVNAITQVGNRIVAAGTFTKVSPATTITDTSDDLNRSGIFAFDATTGAIDSSFDPNLGGTANSLDTDGTSVYVGGRFSSVSGNSDVSRVAKLSASGSLDPTFRAVPSAEVNEVVVRGGRVYIGGAFTTVRSGTVVSNRGALAALDPSTGAVLGAVDVPFTGSYDGRGATHIKRFDVTPDGSRLVAIGNFNTVGGLARSQIAMLDTSGATATVAGWATNRLDRAHNNCATNFDSFMRDLDISPDGTYFVLSTTGAFAGGAASGTMCDTTSRWEIASTGNEPSWTDYTGGDTTYGVAITGGAVYVGGHMRWQNNPYQADAAGPGAVARRGIAALDPVNGLPLSWNPGRERGLGAQAMFATSQGLWVGSDTAEFNYMPRGRIAFLPLRRGAGAIPAVAAATLPNDLFMAQGTSPGALLRRPVRASGAPSAAPSTVNTGTTTVDWSTLRGAFLLNGTLIYGLPDGGLHSRTFNKTTGALGAETTVDLHDDPDDGGRIPFAIADLTGLFYDTATHRIYYTVLGDARLFYRYFIPESLVVGAQTFVAETNGVSFASAAGTTLAGGRIIFGSSAKGTLSSAPFAGGRVTGAPKLLSIDGTWKSRAMFVPNS